MMLIKSPLSAVGRRGDGIRVGIAFVVTAFYCLAMLVRPAQIWPEPIVNIMLSSSNAVYEILRAFLSAAGFEHPSPELVNGAYWLTASGIVPLMAAMLLLRATPTSLGCRRLNRTGWRLLVLGFIVAMPFVYFMAMGLGMRAYYLPELARAGGIAFLVYYLIIMLAQHFFFHGVMLAAFRSDGRWPAPLPSAKTGYVSGCCPRVRRWLGIGLGQRGHVRNTIASWWGLAPGCGFAIFASAALFALVHIGKDWREATLAFPGGLAMAYIAYRGDSWLIPFFLHALTAGATLGLMLLL